MSAFYDLAEEITQRLKGVSALGAIAIITERQRDIQKEVEAAVGKQSGSVIVVAWTSGNIEDDPAQGPRFEGVFTVTGFFKPVIRPGMMPADEVMQAIVVALHDWIPNSGHGIRYNRLRVNSVAPGTIGNLLTYQVTLTATVQLPTPDNNGNIPPPPEP